MTAPAIERFRSRDWIVFEEPAVRSAAGRAQPECADDVCDNVRRRIAAAHVHGKVCDFPIFVEVELDADAGQSSASPMMDR
jgi:hypothetical protein